MFHPQHDGQDLLRWVLAYADEQRRRGRRLNDEEQEELLMKERDADRTGD